MVELSAIDYKMLAYIKKYPNSTPAQREREIKNNNPKRFDLLLENRLIDTTFEIIKPPTDVAALPFQVPTCIFTITQAGEKALEDYRSRRRQSLIERVWLPIVVSLLTNLAIFLAKWLLQKV